MTAFLAPDPIQSTQFIPGGNTPAAGGLLFCYLVGSTTKQNTYTDPTASTARTNPIVLDSGGNIPGNGEVWIASTAKFVLAPSNDTDPPVSPYWSRDNLAGINDPSQIQTEWISFPLAPTFINGSTFSFSGDQTSVFTPQRRLRTVNTSGTRYSAISSSIFGTSTTIGIISDSIGLDSGLSAVSYALLNSTNQSIPFFVQGGTGATGRSLNAKLGDIVSIKDFGAVNVTGTDNTTAFNNALAYISTAPVKEIYFPAGTYDYSTSPNWAVAGIRLQALGKVVLNHTGNGNAWIFDGGATSGAVYDCRMEGDFQINGNSSSVNGLYNRSVHHSHFQARVINCATSGAGIRVDFAVCNMYFLPRVSINEDTFTSKPLIGMLLTKRGANEPVSYNTIITPIMEGVGTGIKLDGADGNVFLGGTAEGCTTRGIEETAACHGNQFINMDLEVNTVDDANCAGVNTTFNNTDSNTVVVLTGSCQTLRGGQFNSVSTNGSGNLFEGIRYNRNGTGSFTDISQSGTAKRSVFNVATALDAEILPSSVSLSTSIPFILTNQTSTVGASTATFTNSLHAGNPIAWPRIMLNGSTVCFPVFLTT